MKRKVFLLVLGLLLIFNTILIQTTLYSQTVNTDQWVIIRFTGASSTGIPGARVVGSYNNGTPVDLGITDNDGNVIIQLAGGVYSFTIYYNNTMQEVTVDITVNPFVTFNIEDMIPWSGGGPTEGVEIRGVVKTLSEKYPVANAAVKVADRETTTDKYGRFSLFITPDYQRIVNSIMVQSKGYALYHKPLEINERELIETNIYLISVDKKEIINPSLASGNIIETQEGASVFFPPMSHITENLVVSITNYNVSTDEIYSVPGDFSAIDISGNEVDLISVGMMDVDIRGETSGTYYSLQGAGVFDITIPVTGNHDIAPEIIPLWYYDTVTSKWIEEGYATKDGAVYRGQVTHFTSWNLDFPIKKSCNVKGKVNDVYTVSGDTYTIKIEFPGYYREKDDYTDLKEFKLVRLPINTEMTITVINNRSGAKASKVITTPSKAGTTKCIGVFNLYFVPIPPIPPVVQYDRFDLDVYFQSLNNPIIFYYATITYDPEFLIVNGGEGTQPGCTTGNDGFLTSAFSNEPGKLNVSGADITFLGKGPREMLHFFRLHFIALKAGETEVQLEIIELRDNLGQIIKDTPEKSSVIVTIK